MYTKSTYMGWCTDQISKNPHVFPGGVKNKGVGFTCPLGPHLRMDNTCSPMSLMDDLLFDLFVLGSYLAVQAHFHSVAGNFQSYWNSPPCTLVCTQAIDQLIYKLIERTLALLGVPHHPGTLGGAPGSLGEK